MLCEKFNSEKDINVKTKVKLFPDISDRDFWENAKEYSYSYFEKIVKKYEGVERPNLTATLYRQFTLNGDRNKYQSVYFSRRTELVNKVVLECFYNDGRFMDDIVDLTWMILEETAWTIPAHTKYAPGCDSLPVERMPYIDLFSAETACTMAFVYQVIGKKLDEISANITPRIVKRIKEHLNEYIENRNYWWMGYHEGSRPNNWNPWINSNILACGFIIEDDEEKLRKLVYKVMTSLDKYYDQYPQDGACDEGPTYWNQAGLAMLEDLWLLNLGTDGQINFFGEEKVHNTLEFFMKYDTGNGQVVNFADAGINVVFYYASLYKMAKLTGNEKTLSFAKHIYDTENVNNMCEEEINKKAPPMGKVFRIMDIVTYSAEMAKIQAEKFTSESDYYLDSIQVVTSRYKTDATQGLFFAAKGGHNDEHHNHNDVGNFIVYKNGSKFIVDSGNMVYRRETFGELRYTLWTTRSVYHNVPEVDGVEQKAGREFAAKNAKYQNTGDKTLFSIDIADSYPDKVIEKWVRTIEYNKPEQVITVTEDFEFAKTSEYSLNFLTPQKVEKTEGGIKLVSDDGETLEVSFSVKMDVEIEKIETDDTLIRRSWGENLCMVRLKSKSKAEKITYTIK